MYQKPWDEWPISTTVWYTRAFILAKNSNIVAADRRSHAISEPTDGDNDDPYVGSLSPVRIGHYTDGIWHHNDVIMSALASQITSLTIIYSTVYSRRGSKKTSKFRVTGLRARNSPVTGEFPAQRASNAEIASIWWRHHGEVWRLLSPSSRLFLRQRVPTTNKGNMTVSYYEPFWVKSPVIHGFLSLWASNSEIVMASSCGPWLDRHRFI